MDIDWASLFSCGMLGGRGKPLEGKPIAMQKYMQCSPEVARVKAELAARQAESAERDAELQRLKTQLIAAEYAASTKWHEVDQLQTALDTAERQATAAECHLYECQPFCRKRGGYTHTVHN